MGSAPRCFLLSAQPANRPAGTAQLAEELTTITGPSSGLPLFFIFVTEFLATHTLPIPFKKDLTSEEEASVQACKKVDALDVSLQGHQQFLHPLRCWLSLPTAEDSSI